MQGNDCLAKILGIVCNVFDAYSTVLFLPESNEEYYLAAHFSLGDHILPDTRIQAGKGLVGWIIRNRQPLLVNNFDRQSDCLGYYSGDGESKIKAFMGCPMSGGRGALCLDSKKTYSFSERDQKILHQFTQLIDAVQSSICSADQEAQERRFYATLKGLRTLKEQNLRWSDFLTAFLAILAENTGFQYCFLAVRDEWGREYSIEGTNRQVLEGEEGDSRAFAIGSGLVGWVFKNNRAVFTAEKESGPSDIPLLGRELTAPAFRSAACLPLLVSRKTRGVLVLADRENLVVTDHLKSFLFLVSDYLASFLENLYLKNKLKLLASEHKAANS
jgi:signal transduction protein with GAF and PtsI domain